MLSLRPAFVLLATLLLAPAAFASAARDPAAPAVAYPTCGTATGITSGPDTLALGVGNVVAQPFDAPGNLAAITPLGWDVSGTHSQTDLGEWDPASLALDPTTVMLRSQAFDASLYWSGQRQIQFVPPVVTRTVPQVADPPLTTLAWVWRTTFNYFGDTQYLKLNKDGNPGWRVARDLVHPTTLLPGTHPVLCETFCLGDESLQSLRLAQCVAHVDTSYGATWESYALRFRVPQTVRLRWIELPLHTLTAVYPGTVSVFDAQGESEPPFGTASALIAADFYTSGYAVPRWGTHNDFDAILTLEANHDYWLVVRTGAAAEVLLHRVRGTEGPDFAAGIGEMYVRESSITPWQPSPGAALGFRLIGEPLNPVGAPPPRPLAFAVSPNPVSDEVSVQWGEARGTLRVEVLDVRGRRVGGATLQAHGAGAWRWRAIDAQGRALPAGVYFVRASDDEGRVGVRRAVVVR